MNSTAAEYNSANPAVSISPPLSEYAKKLELRVRQRYLENISAIGIDPVLIERKNFQPDHLPPVNVQMSYSRDSCSSAIEVS